MSDATEITQFDAHALGALIRSRGASSVEVVWAFLDRIQHVNPSLNALTTWAPERALRAATRADRSLARRVKPGRLHGVPVLLKDSHRVAGMATTVGDENAPLQVASSDGYVAARLRREGAIVLGKTNVPLNLNDFQTDNRTTGRTNNPWNLSRTPGGSSGGAAAAVAAYMTPFEIGSDIAGSIRIPAHFCGVLGLRPTFSLIPQHGHIAEPRSHPRGGGIANLVSIGPLARSFADVRLLLDVLAGPHVSPGRAVDPPRLRVGVASSFPGLAVAASIQAAVEAVGASAAEHGARVEAANLSVDLSVHQLGWVTLYDAVRRHGAGWRSSRVAATLQSRAQQDWDRLLARYDAIICPPAMCAAFAHRRTGTDICVDGVPIPYWRIARYATPFSLGGHPALVFPVGLDRQGMPIGVQVIGARHADRTLLAVGEWLASLVPPLPKLPEDPFRRD